MNRNPVGWFEIYVEDMARAKAFYEAVFSHKLEKLDSPTPDDEMWAFPMSMDAAGASGALVRMKGVAAGGGGTLVYFSCADCALEAGRVVDAGGKVYRDKFPIGSYGYIALVVDSEGNMIGLHSQA